MPGKIVPFVPRRHGYASPTKPKRAGSALVFKFPNALSKIRNFSGGIRPRAFQLLTADKPTPAKDATAAVPPSLSTTASIEVSIPYQYSRFVNMSSLHATAIDFAVWRGNTPRVPQTAKTIGKRLEMTRGALGVSAAQLCRAIDCKPNRWSQYETGERRITMAVADRLCDEYRLTLDWIYRGDPSGLPVRLHQKLSVAAA